MEELSQEYVKLEQEHAFCAYCGMKHHVSANFCPGCGRKLPQYVYQPKSGGEEQAKPEKVEFEKAKSELVKSVQKSVKRGSELVKNVQETVKQELEPVKETVKQKLEPMKESVKESAKQELEPMKESVKQRLEPIMPELAQPGEGKVLEQEAAQPNPEPVNLAQESANQAQEPENKAQQSANQMLGRASRDGSSFGYALIGFLLPVVGLVLYLVWHEELPMRARSAGRGALVGVILYVGFLVVKVVVPLYYIRNILGVPYY